MLKKTATFLMALCLLGTSVPAVCAGEIPGSSFSRWNTAGGARAVYTQDLFEIAEEISGRGLGLEDGLGQIEDIACDRTGVTYILTADSHIFSFDESGKSLGRLTVTENGAEAVFDEAQGLYISDSGYLYIADTKNNRVLICDKSGIVTATVEAPDSALLPDNFVFSPIKVALDSKEYLYVVSEGAYYGALLFTPEGTFTGFYGSNSVYKSALTKIEYIWDLITQNDVKRSKTVKTLPFQFIDLMVDGDDFVYTCTGGSSADSLGQIRMLSPGGSNVLYKQLAGSTKQSSDNVNFGETDAVQRNRKSVKQNFIGVQVDGDGYIYALDQTWGLIYVYDSDCNLIQAFGGLSTEEQEGLFSRPVALEVSGDRLLVADAVKNTVTVFTRTAYGQLVMDAQKLALDGDYTEAAPLWEQVAQLDANNQLAVCGLAKSAYAAGEYNLAMELAEQGYDSTTYSQALGRVQSAFVNDNFVWLALAAVLLAAALVGGAIALRRRKTALIRNKRVQVLFSGIVHPFDSYHALKQDGLASVGLASIVLLVYYVSSVLCVTGSNFRYTSFDPASYNSVYQLVQTIGLIGLWSLCNWGISTLMQGKGWLKEIYTVSCYCTLPLIVYNLLAIPMSYILSTDSNVLLSGMHTLALILTGIVLVFGLMVIQDFSFPRFLIVAMVTVLFMILIVFMLFMVAMLLSQAWEFVVTLFMEAFFR